MPLRILLAAMSLDLGGAETHVVGLARELKNRGHHVIVVSNGGRLVPDLQASGVSHTVVPLHTRKPWKLMASIGKIKNIIRNERIDVLHAHARIPAWVLTKAASGSCIPVITTYHGVYKSGFPWNLVTVPGDMTIAVSEDVKHHLETKFGFRKDKLTVIPNGIDTERFSPGTADSAVYDALGIARARPTVVHVSRLTGPFAEVSKCLIEAFPMMWNDLPGLQLVIVGDGDRIDEIRSLACKTNIKMGCHSVVVTGGVVNMPPIFQVADVVVGVARVALEAMACEKPVIIAGEGGIAGVVTPETLPSMTSRNFTARGIGEPLSASRLSEMVKQVFHLPDLGADLGRMGRRYVEDNLSMSKMVDRIEAVYSRALNERSLH